MELIGTCNVCGKNFKYRKSNRTGKYCSRECCYLSKEFREKIKIRRIGKKASNETKLKMSLSAKGKKKNKEWVRKIVESRMRNIDKNGRKTPGITLLKTSKRFADWRNEIFKRDNFTCQECGDSKGGNLEAHHLISFSFVFEEYKITGNDNLLFDLDNGITLCTNCHKKTDSYAKHQNHHIEFKMLNTIRNMWEQTNKARTFNEYYLEQMTKLNNWLKEKLN